jgi:hypothetical protein
MSISRETLVLQARPNEPCTDGSGSGGEWPSELAAWLTDLSETAAQIAHWLDAPEPGERKEVPR